MKQAIEYVHGLRYKLLTMGIPCEDPAFVYGGNKFLLANTTVAAYTPKKKTNSLSYHFFREGCEQYEWSTAYVNMNFNLADLITKKSLQGRNDGGL